MKKTKKIVLCDPTKPADTSSALPKKGQYAFLQPHEGIVRLFMLGAIAIATFPSIVTVMAQSPMVTPPPPLSSGAIAMMGTSSTGSGPMMPPPGGDNGMNIPSMGGSGTMPNFDVPLLPPPPMITGNNPQPMPLFNNPMPSVFQPSTPTPTATGTVMPSNPVGTPARWGAMKPSPQGSAMSDIQNMSGSLKEDMDKMQKQQEDQQTQMEKIQEEQQKKMSARRSKEMLSSVKRGSRDMQSGITFIQSMSTQVKKNGLTVSQELNDAIQKANDFFNFIKGLKEEDASDESVLQSKMVDMMQISSTLKTWGPRMQQLLDLSQRFKEYQEELEHLDKDISSGKTIAAKIKDIDLSSLIDELDTSASDAKDALAAVKGETNPMRIQKEVDSLGENLDTISANIQVVKSIKRLPKELSRLKRDIQRHDRDIKNLKRRVDTKEMESLQADFKRMIAEITTSLKKKPVDYDDVIDMLGNIYMTNGSIDDIARKYGIGGGATPTATVGPSTSTGFDIGAFDVFGSTPTEPQPASLAPEPAH